MKLAIDASPLAVAAGMRRVRRDSAHREFGYEPIEVPDLAVEERAMFILGRVPKG